MRKYFALPAVVALAALGLSSTAHAQACGTIVGTNGDATAFSITTDTTWGGVTNPGPICLEEPIYIGDGTTGGSTVLTILPGTIVRGQPRRDAVMVPGILDDNPGALIVTRFSQVIADGTPSAPIVMTTAAVDNNADGVCDDGDGDSFADAHPGFVDVPAGCIDAGTCVTAAAPAAATFCDTSPLAEILSPLDADGEENVSLWGGFAISGNAPTNLADSTSPTSTIGEGLLEGVAVPATPALFATYGGPDPHDNSGVVRYVSVRHAGDEIIENGELNGVSLAGVGDGTVYEFVEVYANFDDGHEWFGGTVNANHIITLYAGDDSFDLDEGYTGTIQFALAIMPFFDEETFDVFGSGSGDRMGEFDGLNGSNVAIRADEAVCGPGTGGSCADGSGNTNDGRPAPFPNPYISNLTGIGSTTDGANPAFSPASTNRGIFWRNGAAGKLVNSIVVNTGSRSCFEVDTDSATDAPTGFLVQDNLGAGELAMVTTSCGDTAAPNATAVANGDAISTAGGGNLTTSSDLLQGEDPDFDGRGTATGLSGAGKYPDTGVSGYNVRPDLGVAEAAAAGSVPQEGALDRSATYRGAFEDTTEIWTSPWSAGAIGGLVD